LTKQWLSRVVAAAMFGAIALLVLPRDGQRALTGGAIGAAGGVAITAFAGGSLVGGALIGVAAGAAIGALIPRQPIGAKRQF
jgi:hypothetical protein